MALFILVSIFLESLSLLDCYNVDTSLPIVFNSPDSKGGHFGFSVTFHSKHRVLVGAPKVDNDKGKVYRCDAHPSPGCQELNHNLDRRDRILRWFGVSVSSQNAPEGGALACSHRYYNSNETMFKGACVLYEHDLGLPKVLGPCESCAACAGGSFNDCQSGASVHYHSGGEILIGAPGYQDGYGNVFKLIREKPLTDGEPFLRFNKKTVSARYAYLGASVRIGRLVKNETTYAVSAPNLKMHGRVFLFTSDSRELVYRKEHVLRGEEPFSAFGADLAVGDFNGDGYEDLVVGAPNYYRQEGATGGAIYVYMNGPEGITSSTVPKRILSRRMKESECAELKCYDARFGISLGSIGDVDMDGYPDLVVGAPFEGDGAVYVFPGSPDGLSERFSQRIAASDAPSSNPIGGRSFGYSISQGPYDVDSNSYPDLVVGSFMADRIFVLRSRPVLNADHEFSASPSVLDYKKPSCPGRPEVGEVNCVEVTVCFRYKLKFDRRDLRFDMRYNVTIVRTPGSMDRASFDLSAQKPNVSSVITMTMQSGNEFECKKHLVYIAKSNKDWLVPIALTMTYDLDNLKKPSDPPSLPSFESFPILNKSLPLEQPKIALTFDKNCGPDNICKCNLKVELSSKLEKNARGRHEMKISQTLRIDATVSNSDEDAHQTKFYLLTPENVKFVGVEKGAHVSCEPADLRTLECDIANPLEPGENVTFSIKLNPGKVSIGQEVLVFEAHVNSTSTELDPNDDHSSLEFEVLTEADLSVVGQSSPSSVFYSYQEIVPSFIPGLIQDVGPPLEHVFEVKNVGKIVLPSSEVVINWPAYLKTGKPLFYLVTEPEVSGSGGQCSYDGNLVNPHNLGDSREPPHYEKLRRTREVQEVKESKTLKCENDRLECVEIRCSINSLKPAESSVVRVYSMFWNSTFQEAFPEDDTVVVLVRARIIAPPSVKQLTIDNDVTEAHTVLLRDELKEEKAPLWIYVIAALAGILLLIMFILILWRCGFFKRKKMEGLEHSVMLTKKEVNEADLR